MTTTTPFPVVTDLDRFRPSWPKDDETGQFVAIPAAVKALDVPLLKEKSWWPKKRGDVWASTGTLWQVSGDFTALLAAAAQLEDPAFVVVRHPDPKGEWFDVTAMGHVAGHRVEVTVRTCRNVRADPDGVTTLPVLQRLAGQEQPPPNLLKPLPIELGSLWDTPMPSVDNGPEDAA